MCAVLSGSMAMRHPAVEPCMCTHCQATRSCTCMCRGAMHDLACRDTHVLCSSGSCSCMAHPRRAAGPAARPRRRRQETAAPGTAPGLHPPGRPRRRCRHCCAGAKVRRLQGGHLGGGRNVGGGIRRGRQQQRQQQRRRVSHKMGLISQRWWGVGV